MRWCRSTFRILEQISGRSISTPRVHGRGLVLLERSLRCPRPITESPLEDPSGVALAGAVEESLARDVVVALVILLRAGRLGKHRIGHRHHDTPNPNPFLKILNFVASR